jgi:5-formyltetrahydrofolate cyclo-ligase
MSERAKALLRDAHNLDNDLTKKARDFIKKNKGKKVPKGYEVSHEIPLYTRRTAAGKRKLDKVGNMKTQKSQLIELGTKKRGSI